MGLLQTVQAAIAQGLNATGNIRQSIQYHLAGTPGYNPTTGNMTVSSTIYSVKAILASYRRDEIDGEVIRPEDQKCILGSSEIRGITPTLNDWLVVGSDVWQIKGVKIDPVQAVWLMQVRRP